MAKETRTPDWVGEVQAARQKLREAAQNYNLADPEVEPVVFAELVEAATELSHVILKAQIAAGLNIEELMARAEEAAVDALQGPRSRSGLSAQWLGVHLVGGNTAGVGVWRH